MARIVVTGGAGFVGSHLCDTLIERGDEVVCLDNFITGRRENVAHLEDERRFELVECDVSVDMPVSGRVDAVMHFASCASPFEYLAHPFETLDAGSLGTRRALELTRANDARLLLASTSEVYGEPQVHPQVESYWGNVNPIGPRSVYDEAKRFAETLTMAYHRELGLDIGIVRIFNTYGPRLRSADGRVVSNFLVQAMEGRPLTIYGDGSQTRSYCFVEDEVRGILALLDSDVVGPVNIGNPDEFTVSELARLVLELTGSASEIVHEPLPVDDPTRRRPDITLAREALGWEPAIPLRIGLERTYEWYQKERARKGI
ncbi:MAG TPA: UDP-glucuronic acid decarboxylase family protein [Acidimicrobiia bacterium]|nr:UDP-glucuronic acid decarboxylase family protein [Acidimicrobiia bacterium]